VRAALLRQLDDRLAARFAVVAGTDRGVARRLVDGARERAGRRAHVARAIAFLVATAPLGRRLPAPVRVRAVGALLTAMFGTPGDLLLYLGLSPTAETTDCRGLLP
jgi:hypothetical protein